MSTSTFVTLRVRKRSPRPRRSPRVRFFPIPDVTPDRHVISFATLGRKRRKHMGRELPPRVHARSFPLPRESTHGLITIQGIIHDSNGTIPTSGTVTFSLSRFIIAFDGAITIPITKTATVSPADGSFSITLESTGDGNPNTAKYAVSFSGVIETVSVTYVFGSFILPPFPATQQLRDLV